MAALRAGVAVIDGVRNRAAPVAAVFGGGVTAAVGCGVSGFGVCTSGTGRNSR